MHVILNISRFVAWIRSQVLESFKEEYRPLIQKLPSKLYPTSCTHGQHSFTVSPDGWGAAKVEVLLRHQAFKPKVNASGTQVKSKNISWSAGVMEAWEKCMEFLRQDEVE